MIPVGKRLHAQISYYSLGTDFYLFDHEDVSGKRLIARSIEFEPFQEGAMLEPSFRLHKNVAQELFEELWRQGFRSAHDKGNSEALDTARREHIGDLRKAAKLL